MNWLSKLKKKPVSSKPSKLLLERSLDTIATQAQQAEGIGIAAANLQLPS